MAKTSGLGGAVIVDDSSGTPNTISDDNTNWQFATPRAVQDVTGVNKSANERILLLADFSVTLNGVFDPASGLAHETFSDIPSTSAVRTVKIQPTSSATPSLSNECILTDYQVTRSNTGELTWQVPGSLADGTPPAWTNS